MCSLGGALFEKAGQAELGCMKGKGGGVSGVSSESWGTYGVLRPVPRVVSHSHLGIEATVQIRTMTVLAWAKMH